MAAKMSASNSSAMTKLVPIGIIAVVVLVVLYFVMSGGSKAPAPAVPAPSAANPAAAPAAPGAAPAEQALPELTPQQLLKEASTALREQRIVTPPGNNAFEYYERLLDKEPNNQTAKDALRETFPIATGPVEQDINAGNLDEATRVINLLAKADPNNYTLTILRSKLDAKKKQVEREQAQQTAAAAAATAKAQQQAAATAANTAAAPAPAAAAPAPAPATPSQAAAETTAANAAPAPANTAARPAAGTAATAAAPAAGGETHAAEVLKTSPPEYPADAARKRQEGWVEIEFTVTPDGTVANASVVSAEPARVFNASALRAVERWTFKPRMENGKPVEEKIRRRIEFKL